MAYLRYIRDGLSKEEIVFSQPLEADTRGEIIFIVGHLPFIVKWIWQIITALQMTTFKFTVHLLTPLVRFVEYHILSSRGSAN